ncbi:MAG: acetate kinase [Holophagales bacterium]|jgi:acetate kinase|nr:acetate kinase [Holophagales bacterium]
MLILTLNAGSSSLKFNLIEMDTETSQAEGIAERIGLPGGGTVKWTIHGEKGSENKHLEDHKEALKTIMSDLRKHALKDRDVAGVGHRVAHGGNLFSDPILITPEVLKEIEALSSLAPLHNPANVHGIETAMELFHKKPQVAVFDTAFHHTIPDYAYTYGLPFDLCKKHGIRRYGFHGTSHRYVAERTAVLLGKPLDSLKIITCHIGNGSSITAIHHGNSVDTSMGLTPLEGIVMGSRSGSVDPGALITLMNKEKLNANSLSTMLNKQSGLLGISGHSSDMREVEDGMLEDDRSRLAFEVLAYGILKYIGAYAAAMDGVDAITFTAGVGENSPVLRSWICLKLQHLLGVHIDESHNELRAKTDRIISTSRSRTAICVVPTNEELMIARYTSKLIAV